MKELRELKPATTAAQTDAATNASSRSINPPWPGIRPLESLTPKRRLSADSNKSPSSDTIAVASPSQNSSIKRFVQAVSMSPRTASASAPTMAPDQVLPGETLGQRLGPPIVRPAKYAATSAP